MDNFRRIFFTKDEVKSLGKELTESTTEDIAVLYIPLHIPSNSTNADYYNVTFGYRTKDHEDLTLYVNNSNKNVSTRITTNHKVRMYGGILDFEHNRVSSNMNIDGSTSVYPCYTYQLAYTSSTNSSTSSYYRQSIESLIGIDASNLYIRVCVPNILVRTIATTVTDFLIKYESGTLPPDTIFYEPYEG